ncbi:hypothetical protein ROZALSC1DRAFT_29207 [Rozella allomycis CSF55]|uniref:Ankyrin n=1 Tax=Rozella allomycis (strain CSF55) TaxID=988480 RepID=A0A075AN59_ROZAC|nr:hypothetical protein O9G_005514 [Rozella allomycis CSF55]RKP19166.1 hypothetical protein ROZALSC1DRAFT_29207 [Rozella allomycis CSF55]|eukprot:EPZ31207.1 hypothetical protein O9G_005514 [Rozella allomycis CSF55]
MSKNYWEKISSRLERVRMTNGKFFGHLLRIGTLGNAKQLWEDMKKYNDRTDSEYYSSLIEKLEQIKLTDNVLEKRAATGVPMTEAQKCHQNDTQFDPSVNEDYALKVDFGRVDPSANDNYAIKWASRNGHAAVVKILLADDRVDPNSYKGHADFVELLLADERVDQSYAYRNG